MKKRLLILLCVFVASLAARGSADELEDLKKEIDKQYDMLLKMQTRIAELEASQKEQDKAIVEKVAAEVEKKQAATLEPISWVKNFKLSGDFRYRYETIEEERDGKGDTNRNRIRVRLMLQAFINDEWDFGLRVATGSADPDSPIQSLDDSFSKKPIWLDLAYAHYHPAWMEGMDVYAGKVENPFYKVGGSQLIWDDDLNPEGGAVKLASKLGENDTLYTNLGAFWVDLDREGDGRVDSGLVGIQSYLRHALAGEDYVIAGAGYYDYGNIKGRGDLKGTWNSSHSLFGNTGTNNRFASDFNIAEVFTEYGTKVAEMPVAVFGDYAKNLTASTSEDTGWLIGAKLGKAKEVGSWEFAYDYRDVEADAVVGAFSDSDFIGGGTDGKGHKFGITCQVAKNVQAALSYYLAEETRTAGRDDDYRRLQIDLRYKF
jgi:hypothetical protein